MGWILPCTCVSLSPSPPLCLGWGGYYCVPVSHYPLLLPCVWDGVDTTVYLCLIIPFSSPVFGMGWILLCTCDSLCRSPPLCLGWGGYYRVPVTHYVVLLHCVWGGVDTTVYLCLIIPFSSPVFGMGGYYSVHVTHYPVLLPCVWGGVDTTVYLCLIIPFSSPVFGMGGYYSVHVTHYPVLLPCVLDGWVLPCTCDSFCHVFGCWWWWCRPHPVREHAQDLRPPLGARPASPPTRQAAQPPPRGSSTNPRPLV